MRKQGWIGLGVIVLVVLLGILVACGGTGQQVTPGAGGSQASTPTKEVAPTATSGVGGNQAATPTKEMAPTATLDSGGTKETPAALDGKALVQERCTKCHDMTRIQQAKKTPDVWKATVQRMIGHGAQLTQAEQDAVIAYLAKTYPQ